VNCDRSRRKACMGCRRRRLGDGQGRAPTPPAGRERVACLRHRPRGGVRRRETVGRVWRGGAASVVTQVDFGGIERKQRR